MAQRRSEPWLLTEVCKNSNRPLHSSQVQQRHKPNGYNVCTVRSTVLLQIPGISDSAHNLAKYKTFLMLITSRPAVHLGSYGIYCRLS
ncbi:hypothetical protein XENTR_v10000638 [Xenopus tropicalis]|nr:hypothetical protein XENTR_v10000638 [Xenopus tropicalis]